MSVIGIDFGNSNSRVAMAGKGGVDVLLNGISKRDNASLVSFGEKERHIGESAADQLVRNAANTVQSVKRFIGLQYGSPELESEMQYVTSKLSGADDKASDIAFQVQYNGESHSFQPEQVFAMILTHLKEIANSYKVSTNLKGSKPSCVLSCPAYFTQNQRIAMLHACEIADIDCLSLLNETTAAALDYGIFKSGEFPAPDSTQSNGIDVCFIDVGHSATTASVVRFFSTEMKVVATCFDENLGTRNIDMILLNYFRDLIQQKYKFDVFTHKKARVRLLQACQKVKTTLSANPVTSLSLECLFEDTDVHFPSFTREEFETLIEEFTRRYSAVCTKILAMASDLSKNSIDVSTLSVELIGGGSRIPMVKTVTQSIFGSQPRATLNATETVSKGCAVLAAMLSPNFKVKEYKISDIAVYPTKIGYFSPQAQVQTTINPSQYPFLSNDVNKVVNVVKVGDSAPKVFDVTFERDETFEVYTFYENSLESGVCRRFTPMQHILNHSTVTNVASDVQIDESILSKTNKVKLRFKINLSGIIDIVSAQVITEYEKECTETCEASQDQKMESVQSETVGEAERASDEAPQEKRIKKERKVSQALIEKHPLEIGMSADSLLRAKQSEKEMSARDALVQKTAETRNSLEECFYEYKYKIVDADGELNRFTQPQDVQKFAQQCAENSAWLESDDGYDASIEDYASRLGPMKDIIDGAVRRYRNFGDVVLGKQEFCQRLEGLQERAIALKAEADGGWHSPEELQKLHEHLGNALDWFKSKSAEAEAQPLFADPVLTNEILAGKYREVEMSTAFVLNKKKPNPPHPKADESKQGSAPEKQDMNVDVDSQDPADSNTK